MLTSGFTNAPATRFLVTFIVASSILASITDSKYYFYIYVVPHFWAYGQFWRIASWQLAYVNSTEVLFAVISVYHLRVVERLWGTRKFTSFLLLVFPLTAIIPPLLLALVLRPATFNHMNYLPAGPTPLLFAILAQYHAAIPPIYTYRVGLWEATDSAPPGSSASAANGPTTSANRNTTTSSAFSASQLSTKTLTLTSKTLSYLPAVQLALSQGLSSLLCAAVGWCVGYAYRNDVLPGTSWRVPGWVVGEDRQDKRAREGLDELRRRLDGEAEEGMRAGGSSSGTGRRGSEGRRRTVGGLLREQFGWRGGGW